MKLIADIPESAMRTFLWGFARAAELTDKRNQFHRVYGLDRGRSEWRCLPLATDRQAVAKRLRELTAILRSNGYIAGKVRASLIGGGA